jgi:hypothetical protein
MKQKLISTVLCLSILISTLSGCNMKKNNITEKETSKATETSAVTDDDNSNILVVNDTISEVDGTTSDDTNTNTTNEKLVEIIYPADFVANMSATDASDDAIANGGVDLVVQKDGSISYKLPVSNYKQLLKTIKNGVDEVVNHIKEDNSATTHYSNITYNKKRSEFTITCDASKYGENDLSTAITINFIASYYQVLVTKGRKSPKVLVHFVDAATGKTIDTIDSTEI